jgi:hypothetical protein
MKQLTLTILLLFTISTNAFADKKEEPKPKTKMVCCESFGYGTKMKKCCESYQMMPPENCQVEEGTAGGGMQIVDNSFCKKNKTK